MSLERWPAIASHGVLLLWFTLSPGRAYGQSQADVAIDRAIGYLSRQVPAWTQDHRCFSCHNNGDGARSLYIAKQGGRKVDKQAVRDTTAWLSDPSKWEHNGGEGPFNDRTLATIQFSATLAEAWRAGFIPNRDTLLVSGRMLIACQHGDGQWQLEGHVGTGGPTTYGPLLATVVARNALATIKAEGFETSIAKADKWLALQRPRTVLDAAAFLLGHKSSKETSPTPVQLECLRLIQQGQDTNRGWGPYAISRAEPFDTAVVLLALANSPLGKLHPKLLKSGRDYLLDTQSPDGSWPETTRPRGNESYSQRVSTTAWAISALMETDDNNPD